MTRINSSKTSILQAFTLIELLVVIAIVAVLAAILLPVMQGMTAKSDAVSCTSRMRQAGTALILYSQEHNRTFPAADNYYSGHKNVITAVEPYLGKDPTVWFCNRYLKDAPGRNAQAIYDGGEFGYYYWAFDALSTDQPLSDASDSTAWTVQGYNTPPLGKVFLSDIFGDHQYWGGTDDVQMHAGISRYLPLQQIGTHVFLSDGSVQIMAPEKPKS